MPHSGWQLLVTNALEGRVVERGMVANAYRERIEATEKVILGV